jgi:hypothetical protein
MAPNVIKFLKPACLSDNVATSLHDQACIRSIRGASSIPAIIEYLQLWGIIQGHITREEVPDKFTWRHADTCSYSVKSVYNLFFLGRMQIPGAKELWSARAPLKHKLHMGLVLKNRM